MPDIKVPLGALTTAEPTITVPVESLVTGEPKVRPNLTAIGGDTINGVDPNAQPGFVQRFLQNTADSMAHPQSVMDFAGLAGLTPSVVGGSLAESAASKLAAPVLDTTGRGLSAVGNAIKRPLSYLGLGDILYSAGRKDPVGAALGIGGTVAPYALDIAGQAAQKGAAILRRDAPLLQFKLGAVEAPTAATVQAAREAAPMATAAAPVAAEVAPAATTFTTDAIKARLNAAETKEYLRLLKSGRSAEDSLGLIQQQREMAQRLGLPDAETVRATRGTNKERILRETP